MPANRPIFAAIPSTQTETTQKDAVPAPIDATPWTRPRRLLTPDGDVRRVGIELEFANLNAERSAHLVEDLFGGTLERTSDFRFHVTGTSLGDFTIELDLRLVHEGEPGDRLRQFAAELGGILLPMEIVCPPVPIPEAHQIDRLRETLRRAGAEGTFANPFYAFGAQLNPELADHGADDVLATLRAYVLLRDWLKAEIGIDMSRRLTFFAAAYPEDWCGLILDPTYRPDMTRLIDDYLAYNPTRFRELDMLPFFALLDENRVRAAVPHEKINARPTFHYRLPNGLIDDPSWTLSREWDRWLAVEALAERADLLAEYGRRWIDNTRRFWPDDWTPTASALRALL